MVSLSSDYKSDETRQRFEAALYKPPKLIFYLKFTNAYTAFFIVLCVFITIAEYSILKYSIHYISYISTSLNLYINYTYIDNEYMNEIHSIYNLFISLRSGIDVVVWRCDDPDISGQVVAMG